jgi:hypothetical protein
MAIKLIVALSCLLPLCACAAQDGAINSDRPDFVDSSDVVGKGRIQLETGIQVDRDEADGMKSRLNSTPTLLRIGVSDNWELRLATDGRLRATSDDLASGMHSRHSGYGDSAIGAKWHLVEARGAWPAMGVIGEWDLDTGSAPFRAQGKGGNLRLAAEWKLADDLNLGTIQGLSWQHNDDGQRYTSGLFGIVLDKSWNDRWRTFVEYSARQIARARDGGTSESVDVGAAWLLSKSVQLDTMVSRGINRNAPDWSWTVGLSLRF